MLIASTVVEVGIDEPEASVMLVENAECFGMAQLHQLRGRVGRGKRSSRCFLMAPAGDSTARARLAVMERSHNGLHIAEADLRARWVFCAVAPSAPGGRARLLQGRRAGDALTVQ